MLKEYFKEFLPRAYSMEGQHNMQITYIFGNVLGFFGACVVAGLMIYLYFFKRRRGMVMYPCFISFFINVAILCALNVLAIWHNYLWVSTTFWLTLGLNFIWMIGQSVEGMDQNKKLKDCEELRAEYDVLKRNADRMEKQIKSLKHDDPT